MAKLEWDKSGERLWETGVEQAALFLVDEAGKYSNGEAWNGLIGITESPSGAEPTALWANDKKYGELLSTEEFGGSIEAYMYPDGFKACNGEAQLVKGVSITQQARKTFGLAYKTLVGNDVVGYKYGYKLHLVYGAKAAVSEKSNQTINDSPEAMTMSWEFSTTPVAVEGFEPTSHLIINSKDVDPEKLAALEAMIYGGADSEPELPLPDKVAELLGEAA